MDSLNFPPLPSSLFVLVLCCCLASSQTTGLRDTEEFDFEKQDGDHFLYSVAGHFRSPADGGLPLIRLQKRYVDEAIPRLADNYYHKNSPVSTGKGYEKDLMSPYPNNGRNFRQMEMIGNMAVPAPQVPQERDEVEHDHTTPENTTPATKKPSVGKKATDPLENGKKSYGNPKKAEAADSGGTQSADPQVSAKDEEDVSVTDDKYPKDITNNTLLKNNITQKQEDHYTYYKCTFIGDANAGKAYWVDMQNEKDVLVSEVLSLSHRKASIIRLSFDFPFFGHIVRNVTVATGGFLYTGDYIHAWLAATQYIAPLMANFDTKSHNSQVRYRDNGTAFTVEWYHVTLEDHTDAGHFTFQVTLHSSGDIVFVYKELPILVEDIEDFNHPVKVGLADAYIIDRTVFLIKRKTIYEYHKVQFKGQDIRNWTVVYMKALPTCLDLKDCHSCLTEDIKFPCKWCPHARRCSTGFDRKRQDWNEKMCDTLAISEPGQCNCARGSGAGCAPASANELTQDKTGAGAGREFSVVNVKYLPPSSPNVRTIRGPDKIGSGVSPASAGSSHSTGGMLAIVFAFVAVFALAMWVLYAYRNPHTPSGQVLIRYRPSHWSLRRGEARYTAATIHM